MIDVGRDDRPPACDLRPHEFGGDFPGHRLRETPEHFGSIGPAWRPGMLVRERVPPSLLRPLAPQLFQPLVFTNGDVLHFRRNDPLLRVPQLGHGMARTGTQRPSPRGSGRLERGVPTRTPGAQRSVFLREKSVVFGGFVAPLVLLDISPGTDPPGPLGGQPLLHTSRKRRIPPRAGGVVEQHRRVLLNRTVRQPGRREPHFPHRHTQLRVNLSLEIHPPGIGKRIRALRMENLRSCVHKERHRVDDRASWLGNSGPHAKKRRCTERKHGPFSV